MTRRIPTSRRWQRLAGSLIKLYVSFAEYCLFDRALLQKRPIILSILPERLVGSRNWVPLILGNELCNEIGTWDIGQRGVALIYIYSNLMLGNDELEGVAALYQGCCSRLLRTAAACNSLILGID